MTTTSRDVAAYLIEQYGPQNKLALMKLVYYVQAWSLTWDGKPAFEDRIEAWEHGPVATGLYFDLPRSTDRVVSPLESGRSAAVGDAVRGIAKAIYAFYGNWRPWDLRNETHDNSAWVFARQGLPEGSRSNAEITDEMMKKWHSREVLQGTPHPHRPPREVSSVSDDRFRAALSRQKAAWAETERRLATR